MKNPILVMFVHIGAALLIIAGLYAATIGGWPSDHVMDSFEWIFSVGVCVLLLAFFVFMALEAINEAKPMPRRMSNIEYAAYLMDNITPLGGGDMDDSFIPDVNALGMSPWEEEAPDYSLYPQQVEDMSKVFMGQLEAGYLINKKAGK